MSALHLCSFVVHVHPRRRARFLQSLSEVQGAELHVLQAEGKGIVTLEACHEDTLARSMETLRGLPGLMALSLVYHHRDAASTGLRGETACT